MVFYRKYRPQTISDLDSSSVRETLHSVLSKKDTPHAFLFTGPKGLGKTSTARIVAKVLNCERLKNNEPCNKCEQCISITNGTSMDILEIDAASNRGIDEIRDLREKVRLAPLSAQKKVYIIDEVHMLTTEAFNALLKTLEEPPAHVVFILCTTEAHKVPATIVSRCFRIQFTRATEEELISSFGRIVKNEKIPIDSDALKLIARLSDGSFRDGAKLLEEVALLSDGKKITQETIEKKFKLGNASHQVSQLLNALFAKDTKGGLQIVAQQTLHGADIPHFIERLIDELHALLLIKAGVEDTASSTEIQQPHTISDISTLVQLLNKAHSDTKYAVIPQLPLEIAVIEYTKHSQSKLASEAPAISDAKSKSVPIKTDTNDILQQMIAQLKSVNPSLVGLLRGFTVKEYDNTSLVLSTKYKYHKDRLVDKKMQSSLKSAAATITGRELDIKIVLQGGET